MKIRCFLLLALLLFQAVNGQNISLLEQFSGRYDFTFIGNTLNYAENNTSTNCTIMSESSADFTLNAGDSVEKAWLFWAGSGSGYPDVLLNGNAVTAETTGNFTYASNPYFCSKAEVTNLLLATGSGTYTFSGMDLTSVINSSTYCYNRTNFGGWALVVVYENQALPINQINVYSGFQGVPQSITITLSSLNVMDQDGAKIGFVAWEGDADLNNQETFTINGDNLTDALNPLNSTFNGTSTVTGQSDLYNMDLDIYPIENTIAVGDTQAIIQLSSVADLVMVSTVVTKLNSQLPDATASIETAEIDCGTRTVNLDYTIYNNGTDNLPAGTAVSFFADGLFLQTVFTAELIAPGGSLPGTVFLTVPDNVADPFSLTVVADADLNGTGTVTELLENNNSAQTEVVFQNIPSFNSPENLVGCNLGNGQGNFDFSSYASLIVVDPADAVTYHTSLESAESGTGAIADPADFTATAPRTIFARITSPSGCYAITSFDLETRNCPPVVYNLVEPDGDNFYDELTIKGLRDIFLNYKLSVFNRWGTLVWTGNNNSPQFNGSANQGIRFLGNDLPGGTYYYLLDLNDADYPEPMTGFLFLKK